ncbi:hypothetical protein BEA19_30275, partial [Escherichia coli]
TDFGGKTSIFSHPVYLFLRKFSLQDFRGGSDRIIKTVMSQKYLIRIAELERLLSEQAEALRQKDQQLSLVEET